MNEIVEDAELLTRVRELSWQLCVNSAQSIRASKALLARIVSPDLDEALDYACELNARSRTSADCIEGVAAFLENVRQNGLRAASGYFVEKWVVAAKRVREFAGSASRRFASLISLTTPT